MKDDAGTALGLWGSFKQCASPVIRLGIDTVSLTFPSLSFSHSAFFTTTFVSDCNSNLLLLHA